jgi:tRNA A37 threonylcarbamoyladenosine modification protein TsaB
MTVTVEKSMLKIVIDATQRNNKVITLFNDGKVLAQKSGDIDMVTNLKNLVSEQGLELSSIDNFDFTDGEGSFTGIKMAAAIANILEWSVKQVPPEKLKQPHYATEPNIQKKLSQY